MPSYTYTARERNGTVQTGQLEAVSEDEVIATLQQRGLFVTAVTKKEVAQGAKAAAVRASRGRRMHGRVKMEDQVMLCQQLATLVEAGVPLLKSLEVVSVQVESRALLVALDQVRRDVESGRTFRDALAKHPTIFSGLWINLVETGEASGHLSEALQQLARHFEAAQHLRNEVQTAMTYPGFLIIACFGVLFVFMYVIIPKFTSMFSAMGMELPAITKFVMVLSKIAQKYVIVVILGGVGFVYMIIYLMRTEAGRWTWDRISINLPMMGTLVRYAQLAEFGQGLGTLLRSGVPLLSGLEILAKSSTNKVYGKAIGEIRDAVKEGKSMAEPMAAMDLFPPMTTQMVLVGEEVGELAKMVGRVAAYYEEQTETFIARMTKLFEPVAILIMGSLVLVIVLSIFMPIFKLATGATMH